MITTTIVSLLDYLRNSQLTEILVCPIDSSIKLIFTFGCISQNFVVQLFELVHISFSKDLDDNEGCYVVYEIKLNEINDRGKDISSLLNYPIKDRQGNILSYPSKTLFHFNLEEDICIEAVCSRYQAYELKSK